MKSVITISIEKKLLLKLDKRISNYKFANRSHGFEYLISREILKKNEVKN